MSAPLLVADSGPLIALARLDLLAIPSRLFGELLVCATVWREVTREPRAADQAALSAAFDAGLLLVVDDPLPIPAVLADVRLDDGERSALALALLRKAVILVDERRGRACATELGLPVLGTLGLLIRAREQGLVKRVRPLADALLAGGYFLARPLVDRALASIGE
jgi:predicted nucleic acid-binding protein